MDIATEEREWAGDQPGPCHVLCRWREEGGEGKGE